MKLLHKPKRKQLLLLIITDLIIPMIISLINKDNKYAMLISIISYILKMFSL